MIWQRRIGRLTLARGLAGLVVAVCVQSVAADEPSADWGRVDRLVVEKEQRRLHVEVDGRRVASLPIGLGFAPTGTKLREGDGATPEGTYRVCVKNPQSQYYLSLGLDYPNTADARRGRADGRIDSEQARAIETAIQAGRCPPWDTPLGGTIYIHGRGSATDWTLGCIALDDDAIERLFAAVAVGTPVEIRP